ncbi:GDSL-type esterase/lipase family protein [Pedobacter sp. Hv1]|uniref:GDSL-type esterase/lipase family protein n=1 Tax=Pedobacter sp. Hv1 TaxID=1740090 RepID=UPI0006D8A398|nr:GDSL-type esterase/lipase family protein [Pedobacter sp. Hv1]KQC02109.1 hypothetical protein AQF98_00610 [Pedobacter sp. Hv1]
MADINNIETIQDLKDVVSEYLTTPRTPKLTGAQLGIIITKTIELVRSSDGEIPVTPDAPTAGVVDAQVFTFGFTVNPEYSALSNYQYRYQETGQSFTSYLEVTQNPIQLPNKNIAVNKLEVRIKAIGINYASEALKNSTAYVEIIAIPIITSQPVNTTVEIGGDLLLSVTASSSTSMSFQWYKNNILMTGKTSNLLTLSNVQIEDAGLYKVIITNSEGSVISNVATALVSSYIINDLSDIDGLVYDMDFASAEATGGGIASAIDNVNEIVVLQPNPDNRPSLIETGGLLDAPYAKFEGRKYLDGPALIPSAEEVTLFIIRRIGEQTGGDLCTFHNGNFNGTYLTDDGYGLFTDWNNYHKAMHTPPTAALEVGMSSTTPFWELEICEFSIYGKKYYDNFGRILNENESAFLPPTLRHRIGGSLKDGLNQDIQRIFVYDKKLTGLERRSITEYFSQNFLLRIPDLVVTEGDSITYGSGSTGGYTTVLGNILRADGYPSQITNYAVNGSRTGDVLSRITRDPIYGTPTPDLFDVRVNNIYTLMIGRNDLTSGDNIEDIWSNIVEICSLMRNAGFKIVLQTVLMSIGELSDAEMLADLLDLNTRIRTNGLEIANAIHDAYAIEETQDPEDTEWYSDGTHPTTALQLIIGNSLSEVVKEVLI